MKQRFRVLLHGQKFRGESDSEISFFTTRFVDALDSGTAASSAKEKVIKELKDRQIREGEGTRLDIHEIGPVNWVRHRIWGSGGGFTFYGVGDQEGYPKIVAVQKTDIIKAATYGFSIFSSLGWITSWLFLTAALVFNSRDGISELLVDPKLILGFFIAPGAMTGISIWLPGYLRRRGRMYAALFVAVVSALFWLSCGQIRG